MIKANNAISCFQLFESLLHCTCIQYFTYLEPDFDELPESDPPIPFRFVFPSTIMMPLSGWDVVGITGIGDFSSL